MHYCNIKKNDIANGTGVRVSLFVSGCTHHCPGCFQPETWDFEYGEIFTEETQNEILTTLSPEYIEGLTLLGGEPMEPQNQQELLPFLKKVKCLYPHKTIWVYSGYTFDELIENSKEFLNLIDVLVDGEFKLELKNISLKFRGSANQRIIDVKKTLKTGNIVLLME